MNKKWVSMILVAVVLGVSSLASIVLLDRDVSAQAASQWEYKVLPMIEVALDLNQALRNGTDLVSAQKKHAEMVEQKLNALGTEGWEYVGDTDAHLIFKRKK